MTEGGGDTAVSDRRYRLHRRTECDGYLTDQVEGTMKILLVYGQRTAVPGG